MTESKIQKYHLERIAYIYLRQSTPGQVRLNQESTRRQYALQEKAQKLGWDTSLIKILDGDLGLSGSESTNRGDFKTLVAEVSLGKVGAVFALEASRLSRSIGDRHRLMELCALTDALIIDEDGCYNPADFNDQLLLGIKGTMSQAELHFICARLQGGKINKAKRGELRIQLPVGYCYDAEKRVIIDNDSQVRHLVKLIFKIFQETGSAYGVTKYFHKNKILFPRRTYGGIWGGELTFNNLSYSRIVDILKNPVYAGVYVYGKNRYQKKLTESGELQSTTISLPLEKWQTVIYGHHEEYISWEEYLQNQKMLKDNQTSTAETMLPLAAREGVALLQGILICGKCGRRLSVRYKSRGRLYPIYGCNWDTSSGAENGACFSIHGERLDQAITKRLFEVIEPAQIKIAIRAFEELEARGNSLEKHWQMNLERAEYEAQLAQKRYEEVDPANRLVAANLEKRWNDTLINLESIRNQYTEYQQTSLTKAISLQKAEIMELATDLPKLWNAESTKMKDKKRIVRLLIKDITVIKLTDPARVKLHIYWQGGATEEAEIVLPKKTSEKWPHSKETIEEVRELALIMTDQEIAEHFNRKGLRTNQGTEFTPRIISRIRSQHKIYLADLQQSDELTVKQLMEKYQVSYSVVRYWIERKVIKPVHRGKILYIKLSDEEGIKLKKWVENSAQLNKIIHQT